MTPGNKVLCLAALAVALLVTACSDYERFRGRTPEQAKQACDPQRQTSEECARHWTSEHGRARHGTHRRQASRSAISLGAVTELGKGQNPDAPAATRVIEER